MLLGFADYRDGAMRLAEQLKMPFAEIKEHRFPDGETRVTLPGVLPERVVICRTLNDPNTKLVTLMLAAKTARSLGAMHISLVAPYLCYMRQDSAFHPGEAVSQLIVGEWLAQVFDEVVTVDPHLHRVHQLVDAVPASRVVTLSAATLMGEFLRNQNRPLILLGPDEESAQWVSVAAKAAGGRFGVCRKIRHADRDTSVVLPDIDLSGQQVVLIDDIASSGGTLMSAARACLAKGAGQVDALVVHALFDEAVTAQLRDAGIANVWSTDSVVHPTNTIPLARLIAGGLTNSA